MDIKVKDIVFRMFDDSIVALRNRTLTARYKADPEKDYCIAYGFIDDECGSSFYVLGTAEAESFAFHEADCPVIVRYSTVKDDAVLFYFPCSDDLLEELYRKADAFTAKRKISLKNKGWRRYGWLDPYRLKEHPDMIKAGLKDLDGTAVMKLFAEDEDKLYGKIVKYEGRSSVSLAAEAEAVKSERPLTIRIK